MKQRKIKALAIILLWVSAAAFAEAQLAIRYFDRRIYYLPDDPVFVQITLSNSGPSAYRFRLADDRAFSIDFDVRTMTNVAVRPAEILVRRRSTSQQVFFREIVVESGESFSFVENLRNFVDIDHSGPMWSRHGYTLNCCGPSAPLRPLLTRKRPWNRTGSA